MLGRDSGPVAQVASLKSSLPTQYSFQATVVKESLYSQVSFEFMNAFQLQVLIYVFFLLTNDNMESKSQHVPPGPDLCSDKGVQANQIDILSSQSGLERDSEKGSRAVVAEVEGEFEEYPSGIKLVLILVAGTLVQFVMMLDQSIISTVR